MNDSEIELSVGETFYIGGYALTVVDIEGEEIQFRIDSPDDDDSGVRPGGIERLFRPR